MRSFQTQSLVLSLSIYRAVALDLALLLIYSKNVKGRNCYFTSNSAIFTSASRQLTSQVRGRLKIRQRTDSWRASSSCVLFLCKTIPTIRPAALHNMTFSLSCAESLPADSETSGQPIQNDMTNNVLMTVFTSFLLSDSVCISIPRAHVICVNDGNYRAPFSENVSVI